MSVKFITWYHENDYIFENNKKFQMIGWMNTASGIFRFV